MKKKRGKKIRKNGLDRLEWLVKKNSKKKEAEKKNLKNRLDGLEWLARDSRPSTMLNKVSVCNYN
jgi:hypothetical protein